MNKSSRSRRVSETPAAALFRSRRGISPLIATVLLLAFAVAIGTMVVSYTIDATRHKPCDDVHIALEANERLCFADNKVSFVISNRGDTTLNSLQVRFINKNQDIVEQLIGRELTAGNAAKLEVDYRTVFPDGVSVTLTPVIKDAGKDKFCSDQALQTKLGPC